MNREVMDLEIIDITEQGQGVAKKDNLVYFIENAIIGETVNIEILEKKKNFIIGKKIETVKKSPYEVKSECEYIGKCSGCTLLDTDYKAQLELKKKSVVNQISRIGDSYAEDINIIGLENPFYYRNKIELKVDTNSNVGYYYKKSHKLVPIKECKVASNVINKVLEEISVIVKKYKFKGYNYKKNTGLIKNITIRANYLDEVQLTVTTAKSDFEGKNEFFEDVFNIKEVVEFNLSINKKKNSETMGDNVKNIFVRKEYRDKIGDYEFRISPKSFFQINSKNNENLYNIALKQMNLKGTENLLDLYCGIGTTTIYFAKHAKSIVGVEVVKDSVKDARYNKKINNIENIEFVLGKSEEKIGELINQNIDIVVVDPPRKGLDKELVEALGKSKIDKIEYISCNPGTLSRDIKYFGEYGFKLKKVECCDMFSHTTHVETVALLER